jgi:hypothetical protein
MVRVTEGFLQGSNSHRSGIIENKQSISSIGLSVYPNPFNESIQTQVSNINGSYKVEVFDVLEKWYMLHHLSTMAMKSM